MHDRGSNNAPKDTGEGPWISAVQLVYDFDKALDDFFKRPGVFSTFYKKHYRSIVNSSHMCLVAYFQELEEKLPPTIDEADFQTYLGLKRTFLTKLDTSDLWLLLGGLYSLEMKELAVDFLQETYQNPELNDGPSQRVQISRDQFASVIGGCKNLLAFYYKVTESIGDALLLLGMFHKRCATCLDDSCDGGYKHWGVFCWK